MTRCLPRGRGPWLRAVWAALLLGGAVLGLWARGLLPALPSPLLQSGDLPVTGTCSVTVRHAWGDIKGAGGESQGAGGERGGGAERRYLIYHCGGRGGGRCGGWADRVKGMVVGYLIAMATNRTFAINITWPPCPLQQFLLPGPGMTWHQLPQSGQLPAQSYDAVDKDAFFRVLQERDLDEVFTSPVVHFRANYEFTASLQGNARYTRPGGPWHWLVNLTNAQLYADVMERLFSLAPPLQAELESFLQRARPGPGDRLVCAQLRVGKSSSNPLDSVVRAGQQDLALVLDFLERQLQQQPGTRLFLASDSAHAREQAGARLGGRLLGLGGEVVHLDRPGPGQDPCQGLRTLLLEQRVLSRCDVLLLSMSGLGRHAAYLRRSEEGLFCLVRGRILPCTPPGLRSLYRVKG